MSDRPWVTAAETCELRPRPPRGRRAATRPSTSTGWIQHLQTDGGGWMTGIVYPELKHFPGGERSTYTAAAVVLTADALSATSPASRLFTDAHPPAGAARPVGSGRRPRRVGTNVGSRVSAGGTPRRGRAGGAPEPTATAASSSHAANATWACDGVDEGHPEPWPTGWSGWGRAARWARPWTGTPGGGRCRRRTRPSKDKATGPRVRRRGLSATSDAGVEVPSSTWRRRRRPSCRRRPRHVAGDGFGPVEQRARSAIDQGVGPQHQRQPAGRPPAAWPPRQRSRPGRGARRGRRGGPRRVDAGGDDGGGDGHRHRHGQSHQGERRPPMTAGVENRVAAYGQLDRCPRPSRPSPWSRPVAALACRSSGRPEDGCPLGSARPGSARSPAPQYPQRAGGGRPR